jgi:hypothetical protein
MQLVIIRAIALPVHFVRVEAKNFKRDRPSVQNKM